MSAPSVDDGLTIPPAPVADATPITDAEMLAGYVVGGLAAWGLIAVAAIAARALYFFFGSLL